MVFRNYLLPKPTAVNVIGNKTDSNFPQKDPYDEACRKLFTICLLIIFPIISLFVLFVGRLMCYNANEIGYIDYFDLYKRNVIVDTWENHFGPFLTNYYFGDREKIPKPNDAFPFDFPYPPIPSPDKCDKIDDEAKFDCFPRGKVTEKDCNTRGCCYAESPKKNVPYCYYPKGFSNYKYVSLNKTDRSVGASLSQQFKSPYPKDIPHLSLSAQFVSSEVLLVTITDDKNSRYRIPFPELPTPVKQIANPLYDFVLDTNSTGFKVIRRSTNRSIFDTDSVGGFIYADQLLQISGLIPTNNIFGIGESRKSFKVGTDWRTITLHNHDRDPHDGVNGYGSHPVYMGLEPDGLAHGVFVLSSYSMDIVIQPTPAITYRIIGGPLVMGFVLGPTPLEVNQQYVNIVGLPYLPPYWALGFHLCRYGYETLDDVIKVWNQTRAAGIPYDTQWTDLDYMKDNNDFSLSEKFKELPSFVNHLHEIGMHYTILIDPGISGSEPKGTYPPLDLGLEKDIFVKDAKGKTPLYGKVWNFNSTVFPDFTHPQAVPYWVQVIEDFHKQVGFDGAWIDMNEPSNLVDGSLSGCPSNQWEEPPYVPAIEGGKLNYKTLCMSSKHHQLEHYAVHNVYGSLEAVVTNFAMVNARDGKRALVISRASSPGIGAYSGHWTGDVHSSWDDMAQSVSDILSFSLFGVPLVGADICGFNDNTTVNLCTRWTQLGAFYPFSRNHNGKTEMPQDPVSLGIGQIAKSALTQRYTYLPYLYTLFHKANAHGSPVVWPTFYIAPEDENTYDLEDQFLWGDGLMIAPGLKQGITFVAPYLPKGIWYYLGNSTDDVQSIESNGKRYSIPAPVEGPVPLLARGGRIIPGQIPSRTTTESRQNPFILIVPLNSSNAAYGSLFTDDGETYEGSFSEIAFVASNNTLKSQVLSWTYNQDLILGEVSILGNFSAVESVKINGQDLNFSFKFHEVIYVTEINWNLKNPFTLTWSAT